MPMQGPKITKFHCFHVTIVECYYGAAIVTIYAHTAHTAIIPALPIIGALPCRLSFTWPAVHPNGVC